MRSASSSSLMRSSSDVFAVIPVGTTTTWSCATRGGRTSPLSSEWTMTMTPIERVESPHEFCQTLSLSPPGFLGSSTAMLNILEKFCPRQ